MVDSFRYLIAKHDSSERKWLPLWVHSSDTYHVMEYLLSHWLTDGALHAVTDNLSLEQIKITALFLSIFHDYGKSSVAFQAKIADQAGELHKKLTDAGLCVPSTYDSELRNADEMPHGIAGEILLLIKKSPASLAAIVGAHHGKPWEDGPEIAKEIEESLEEDEDDFFKNFNYGLRLWGGRARRNEWIKAQNAFYKWAIDELKIADIHDIPIIGDVEAVVLSGLVIMADWLASNEEYFPLIDYGQDSPYSMEERTKQALKRISLPPTWRPHRIENFRLLSKERFGFYPNEIQTKIAEAVINSKNPGLFILEAPMGIGKTEGALLAAEELSQDRVSGILFALPTQATANGIFPRILEWGNGQSDNNYLSIRLAHGMAAMNEEYASIIDRGKHAECVVDDYDNNHLIVHEFFQGSKQALLADFVVGTVDQVLMASLKQKHFMLRHLGLCGKAVIIDECHAYDAYMNEYLERTLQWLGAYRTPVIMLSATLPYERRAAFVDAYMGNSTGEKGQAWRTSKGYPLLTWTDGEKICQEEIEYSGSKRNVEVVKVDCPDTIQEQAASVIDILSTNLKDGGCAAIIVNTVNRAQTMASMIKNALPDKHVLLLHSRFISEDRLEYEKKLLASIGKESTQSERDGFIVIGTQVIEQSLDYDVDLMITDLCPMDLLLQRIGRLHRHPKHDEARPALLKTARCYVLGALEELDRGSVNVYGRYLLMRTKGFLPNRITLPNDIATLTQNVYDDAVRVLIPPAEYDKASVEHRLKKSKDRKDADAFRLLPPRKEHTINRFLKSSVLMDEEQATAQVRNGDASLEVIVLFDIKGNLTRAPWRHKDAFNYSGCPSSSECKAIANQRVRLPSWVISDINFEKLQVPPEWETSAWLRRQHLLILNERGEAAVGNLLIRYDYSYGLSVERGSQS